MQDFNTASFLYEEAAVLSSRLKEPPGIAASYYLEAANCAEAYYQERRQNRIKHSSITPTTSINKHSDSKSDQNRPKPLKPTMDRVMLMLDTAATHYGKATRSNMAADVYKRMAILYEEEIHDSESALKYFEKASNDYNSANFFNNAVDCDVHRANIVLKTNPHQSLGIFKTVAQKLIKKQQITLAKPIVYKIVMLTASLYDAEAAKKASDSFIATNRSFNASYDLMRFRCFLDALEEEDVTVVDDIIEETRDKWAKDILAKLKKDTFLSSDINLT